MPEPNEVNVEHDGWQHHDLRFGESTLTFRVKGEGPPVLVLPHDNGWAPDTVFIDALARSGRVYAPWLPGFHNGHPDEWTWVNDTRDVALVLASVVRQLGLSRLSVVGLGYGGWIAAEMACANPALFEHITLVAPMGIRPDQGAIYDQFLAASQHYAERAYHDRSVFVRTYTEEPPYEQLEAWETDREMLGRIAWKPYLYNPTLERLLVGVDVPTVVVHGDDDRIVPRRASEQYVAALANARLVDLADCGHAAEVEQPTQLTGIVTGALSTPAR
jgi:pimeloyl-ACP methyl ester carboxylesterase